MDLAHYILGCLMVLAIALCVLACALAVEAIFTRLR